MKSKKVVLTAAIVWFAAVFLLFNRVWKLLYAFILLSLC